MDDQRYAVINSLSNIVVNVVMWNGDTGPDGWHPPEGTFVIQSDSANMGDIYDPENGSFTPPAP